MIPRLGDGNGDKVLSGYGTGFSLENDSPSRGRKHPKGGNENGKYQ